MSIVIVVLTVLGFGVAVGLQWWSLAQRPSPETMYAYEFNTCAEARAVHAAPLVRGEPWYRDQLDRDRDGVACEFHLPTAAKDLLYRLSEWWMRQGLNL